MKVTDADAVLDEQAAYYRSRAAEYDEWWQRLGRYDRGAEATQHWRTEIQELERALDRFAPAGSVLELASGTGWWTRQLARHATSLTCIDASSETIAVNRGRVAAEGLPIPTYVQADLFAWQPTSQYDVVFWNTVAAALKPGGRVFFIDSRPDETSTAQDHDMPDSKGVQVRKLNDGRTFRIVKLFYEPEDLTGRLRRLGWNASCAATQRYFLYGQAAIR
jgi:SAM-dependent methyltransferase